MLKDTFRDTLGVGPVCTPTLRTAPLIFAAVLALLLTLRLIKNRAAARNYLTFAVTRINGIADRRTRRAAWAIRIARNADFPKTHTFGIKQQKAAA